MYQEKKRLDCIRLIVVRRGGVRKDREGDGELNFEKRRDIRDPQRIKRRRRNKDLQNTLGVRDRPTSSRSPDLPPSSSSPLFSLRSVF